MTRTDLAEQGSSVDYADSPEERRFSTLPKSTPKIQTRTRRPTKFRKDRKEFASPRSGLDLRGGGGEEKSEYQQDFEENERWIREIEANRDHPQAHRLAGYKRHRDEALANWQQEVEWNRGQETALRRALGGGTERTRRPGGGTGRLRPAPLRTVRRERRRDVPPGGEIEDEPPRRMTAEDVLDLIRRNRDRRRTEREERRPKHDVVTPPLRGKALSSGVVTGKVGRPSIIQKVTVQQETKIKKKTRVSPVASKRKEYTKIKRELLAAFRKAKKASYDRAKAEFKKVPAKERKEARQKLKKELDDKLKQLKKQLPSAARLKRSDIDKLISIAKQLKW